MLEAADLRPPISNADTSHSETPEKLEAIEAPPTDRTLGDRASGFGPLAALPDRRCFFTPDDILGNTISLICDAATIESREAADLGAEIINMGRGRSYRCTR